MKRLFAFDLVILAYMAVITAIVVAARPEGTGFYLGGHALVLFLIAMLAHAHARFGGRFWTFCRYWYVVPVIMLSFRELHYLIPQVHAFDDRRFDRMLAMLDRRWFGDVDGFFLAAANPLLVDVLHLCYWSYFASMFVAASILYARGELPRVRDYVAVLMTGFYLSYLGYLLVPAVGPHHILPARPRELDGWLVGRHLHGALMEIEWEMPDAFPSGHALMSMVVLVLMWRHHPPTFWALLFPALGCVVATMALRYHYVVDVVASLGLLPVSVWIGTAVNAGWEARSSGLKPQASGDSPPPPCRGEAREGASPEA